MKRKIFLLVLTLVLAGLFPVPTVGQRLDAKSDDAVWKMGKKKAGHMFSNVEDLKADRQADIDFRDAFKKDDAVTLERLVEEFPYKNYLGEFVGDEDEYGYRDRMPFICKAAMEGKVRIVKYMLDKNPSLMKQECVIDKRLYPSRRSYQQTGHLLRVAAIYGQTDVANLVLSRGARINEDNWIFDEVASQCRDEEGLKELIPAFLDAGVDITLLGWMGFTGQSGDVFLVASEKENDAFIKIFRDELIKRNKEPRGHYEVIVCDTPGAHKDKARIIENAKKSIFVERVEKHGVPVDVTVYFTSRDCD